MARKSKRPRRSPAATPTRGSTDRDKAIDALMSLLADHSFEQVGLAEVAGRAGIKLSQLRAEFGSTLAILAAHIKEIDRVVLAGGDNREYQYKCHVCCRIHLSTLTGITAVFPRGIHYGVDTVGI